VARFEARGWSVFWDRTSLLPGQDFGRVIERELAVASCVVVLWSRSSAEARWVRAEAAEGARRDVAVPILLDEVELPLLFRDVLAADLSGWDGEGEHPGLPRLFRAVEQRIEAGRARAATAASTSGAPPSTAARQVPKPPSTGRRRSLPARWRPAYLGIGFAFAAVILFSLWHWGPWRTEPPQVAPSVTDREEGPNKLPTTDPSVADTGETPGFAGSQAGLFTLEVLDAGHGESYLLHWDDPSRPRFALLDGGAAQAYRRVLKERLEQLRRRWKPGRSLPLELVTVSQSSDHRIGGILQLLKDLQRARAVGLEPPYAIGTLWYNGFELPGNATEAALLPPRMRGVAHAVLRSPGPAVADMPELRFASVLQGWTLLTEARRLEIAVNRPFDRLVMLPERGAARVALDGGLTITVLGPRREQVLELFDEWLQRLLQQRKISAGDAAVMRSHRDAWTTESFSDESIKLLSNPGLPPTATVAPAARMGSVASAAYVDRSVFNLSSIILLLEKGGRRMLLPGDARGDHVLAGLTQAGLLLAGGTLHLDVLQVPHQGSDRSVAKDFFEKVTADRYVINGNGKFGNPESATLQMIAQARGNADYAIYFTHPDGEGELRVRLEEFFDAERGRDRQYDVFFRAQTSSSMRIDLLEPAGN
jgi:TIR domain